MSYRSLKSGKYQLRTREDLLSQFGHFETMPFICVPRMQRILGTWVDITVRDDGLTFRVNTCGGCVWHPVYLELPYVNGERL